MYHFTLFLEAKKMWINSNKCGNQSLLLCPSETTTRTRRLSGRKEKLLCFRWVSTPVSSLLSLHPPSTNVLGWIVLTEWSILGRYGINRLDSAVMAGHKSALLAASMPLCATYKDQGYQIAALPSEESGHACLCRREVITHHKAIKTWWVWGC